MGNMITRLGRRTFRIRMKRSKKNRGRNINESDCECITIPNTGITQMCMKCMAKIMQEVTTSRLNEEHSNKSAFDYGAQFDAKKFDKIFKLKPNRASLKNDSDSSESDDFEFDDAVSASFEWNTFNISEKIPTQVAQDDDSCSEKSYLSIFEVFEKLERHAILTSSDLDEMFFYPAIGESGECAESKREISNLSTINDKKCVEDTNQTDDSLLDETHLYDTVASSEKTSETLRSSSDLLCCKTEETKLHCTGTEEGNNDKTRTQNKPIQFNTTQFYTQQIDDIKFEGIIFNDSQFDAKDFNATQFDVTQFLVDKIQNSKPDPTLKHKEICKLKNANPKAQQIDVKSQVKGVKCSILKSKDSIYNRTENQCDDVKLSSALFRPNVTEFEASINRAAEFVASHFGAKKLNDKQNYNKEMIMAPFYPLQFNGSQFDAKQFEESQISVSKFDGSDFYPVQFTASQFDAKAFEAQKCNQFRKMSAQILPDDCFNITQFDAKLFNKVQRDLRRVYAT